MPSATSNVPSWDSLIADLRSGHGSEARHDVGAWAMERVRGALGDAWPQRWYARCGSLPVFVSEPASNAIAYAQLLETGLRLESLAGSLRFRRLTKEWSSHLEEIRLLHVRLQLEVAALARSRGASVEFETPVELPETCRPADVLIDLSGEQLIAECFCVHSDAGTVEAVGYDTSLGRHVTMTEQRFDVRITGTWHVRMPAQDTADLLAEIDNTSAQVLADGVPREVSRPGMTFHVASWTPPATDSEITLQGPETSAAGWPRAGGIVSGKARDWAGSPIPVWLRFDLLDGTWLFSDWAQRSLPEKTEWMAALIGQSVAGSGVAGAVVSAGLAIDPQAPEEQHIGTGGIVGLRTRLDQLRYRETIIVPLSPAGARQKRLWMDLYEAETHWLKDALASASLPAFDEIERGWSVPDD